ncbi:MAG: methyltransferase domain-containing protein [Ignavibacteria bacterium]|jgi:ubiquinone/menaquinone biosynthesis C-methylase UbiE
MQNKLFFDQLAADYDEMISFGESLERKKKLFANIVTPKMSYAADCGCGTGVDSIALSQLGLKVTGFDPSDEMIKKAKINAKNYNEKIEFSEATIHGIDDNFENKFDLIVSLGNTFANIKKSDLKDSVNKCYKLLNKNGTLIIHILNYYKILKEYNRIVNITEGKGKYFVRFYDFKENEIDFNLLVFNPANLSGYNLITTSVYPHSKDDFNHTLNDTGFKQVEYFSNLKFDRFSIHSSKDLLIRALKG